MNTRFAQIVVVLSAFLSMVVLGSCGGNSGAPMVTLTSVMVTSAGQTLAVGSTMQFTATGHFSDGSTSDITASVLWVSSDPTAATIDASGLAKGVTAGKSTTISATKDNVPGSSLLMVVAAPAPTITSLNPTSGAVGASVVIAGANFGATQGTSTVKFNGVASTPTVWGASSITAPVPVGTTTGSVVVTVGGVPSNGVTFTVTLPPPSITSLNPTTGVVGTSVVIAGANFGATQGASTVKFNGIASTPTAWSASSITAPVPTGTTTGSVVVTVGGVPSNGVTFTVTLPPPSITSLNPTTGVVGTSVVIAGANFGATQGASTVKFNGIASTPTAWSASSITAPVPTGTTTGSVVVTVGGVPSNGVTFTVTLPPPSITSLNPTTGVVGTSVVIAGANFGATQGASTVKFNGVASTPTVWGVSSISAPVPVGATTGKVVVTVAGVASNGVAFTVTLPPPSITSLNPTSGVVGTSVVIAGANFGATQGTSTVKFDGVASTPTVWSASSITAPVPTGATTGSVVVTVGGVASNGVSFTVTTSTITVTISPKRAGVTLTQPQQFTGTVTGDPLNGGVRWSVDGVNGGGSASGTVSGSGLYTPGTQAGVHTVTATSNSNTSVSASATVAVTDLAGVFTYHNDTARTGQNVKEYALTTSTVNSSTFGALFTCGNLDGYLYAAPLYYANLNVGGVTHNVVFVATEHDSVYAFDADSPACVQLWKTSFISPPNVVPVAPADVDELSDLIPEIGITSTPVIDPTSNTIYVMAKTKEFVGTVSGVACTSSAPCFVHRLHALSVTDGTEKFGGPVVVTAPNFIPLFHLQRPALLLNNGTVYVAIGSHGDNNTWQGWLMAYNATTLAQLWVYNATDPTSGNNEGAIWGSGNGPAVDASGNIYVETGNGNFDGTKNFSDSVIKVSPAGARLDFFTPFDQQIMQNNDIDLGSSNPIILPDSVGSTAHPHLMIAMGKVGVIYLLDQTNMGEFNAAANQDVEEVTISFNTSSSVLGFYGQPAYWNGNLYEIVVNDSLRQLPIANGNIATSSTSHSTNTFTFRGATPVVSASGTTNGIVWVSDITAYQSSGATILDAYDANNVGTMLFQSPSSGTGSAPIAVKFAVPTVANGKVYVGGQKAFTVFGLLPN